MRIDHPPARPSTRPMMIIVRPLTAVSLVRSTARRRVAAASVAAHGAPRSPPVGGDRRRVTRVRDARCLWLGGGMPSLTRAEATTRAALLAVDAVEVDLDLDRGAEVFGSRTTIRFTCRTPGAATFVDLRPRALHAVTLNGRPLDPASLVDGRLDAHRPRRPTTCSRSRRRWPTATTAQGLHRSVDPADGEHYVYGHLFLDAAPTRVRLLRPARPQGALHRRRSRAPAGVDRARQRRRPRSSRPGAPSWPTTPPLATYFVTVCAGPYASVRAEHDGIPLGVARAALARAVPARAGRARCSTTTRACFDDYHRLFGIRYPFGEYHQVFVPEFNAGAMENPGCVTFRDPMIFRGAATPDQVLARAATPSPTRWRTCGSATS